MSVRPPAVAGTFYPAKQRSLAAEVRRLLAQADLVDLPFEPGMLIVPHAGYLYSGAVAATAYRQLDDRPVRRVGVIGPSHFVGFGGVAIPGHDQVSTPLGEVSVDPLARRLVADGLAEVSENAHRREHSLEVQLPFLQCQTPDVEVLPVLTGDDDPTVASLVVDRMVTAGLFVIVSSDLSHYLDHESALRRDAVTARHITELREADLGRDSACGRTAIRAALRSADNRGWSCAALDLRTSADTAGPRDRVVGYGAFALGPG